MAPEIHRRKSLVAAEFLLLLLVLAVSTVLYFSGDPLPPNTISVKAKILKLENETELKAGWLKTGGQEMTVRILSDPFQNREIKVSNLLVGNLMIDRYVRVGDRAVLNLTVVDGGIQNAKLIDYDRRYWHGAIFLVFAVLLLLFSRSTGFKALASFVFTVLVMTRAVIPMIINGYDSLGLCLGLSLVFGITTLLLVGGFSIRSYSAIAAFVIGLGLSAGLLIVAGEGMHLATSFSEHAITLLYSGSAHLNITRIFFGAVILGASGAMVDIGMAIATAVGEVADANPAIELKKLITSGLEVGRATLGTMATTLLLAYAGCSIFLFITFTANSTHLIRILNFNAIAAEILRTLCGSIGLVLIAPLTAIVAGVWYHREPAKKHKPTIEASAQRPILPIDTGTPIRRLPFFRRDTIFAAAIVLFALGTLWIVGAKTPSGSHPVSVKVVRTEDAVKKLGTIAIGRQQLVLRILDAPFKGRQLEVTNPILGHVLTDRYYKPGDKALVMLDIQDHEIHDAKVVDHDRRQWQAALLILFAGLLIGFARMTGIRAFISFFFSLVVLFKIFFPAILIGYDPLGVCTVFAFLFGVITLLLVGGLNIRSAAAVIGFTIGIILTTGLTFWGGKGMYLRGITSDWAVFLVQTGHPGLDLTRILIGSIIIGASGAMVDVAISVATCVREVARANPTLGFSRLTRSGFELGRAELGTMTTTLLLAYMGVNLFLILLYATKGTPMEVILNNGVMSHEIFRALAGSIGMVLTAPVTAVVAALLYRRQKSTTGAILPQDLS